MSCDSRYLTSALECFPEHLESAELTRASEISVCMIKAESVDFPVVNPCDDVVLCLCLKDIGLVRWGYDGGHRFETRARAGAMFLSPAQAQAVWSGDSGCTTLEIGIPKRLVCETLSNAGWKGNQNLHALVGKKFFNEFLSSGCLALHRASAYDSSVAEQFSDHVAQILILGLARLAEPRLWREGRDRKLSLHEMRRIKGFLRDNLSFPIRLADLAGVLNMSPFHFSRSFKATTGESPYRWVSDARLAIAREKLAMGIETRGEIAKSCGLRDARELARQLRMHPRR